VAYVVRISLNPEVFGIDRSAPPTIAAANRAARAAARAMAARVPGSALQRWETRAGHARIQLDMPADAEGRTGWALVEVVRGQPRHHGVGLG